MKIKKRIIKNWQLIIIILLATLLRFWKLGSIPPHLSPDEAALGYNAFSILKTGRDEYGEVLPFVFKSFGDFKPGLYIYMTVPSLLIFGLNEFAVRATSALMGVVAVLLIYFIAQKLFEGENSGKFLGLSTSFFLAISPWHIHFSRGAWEANVALTFALLGTYFYLKSTEERKNIIYSAISFGLTLLTYQGAKLSSLILIFLLVLIFPKILTKAKAKFLVLALVIGILISLPILASFFQGKTGRLSVFSVFSHRRPQEYLGTQLAQGNEKIGDLSYYLFHPETNNILRGIVGRWFNHFSGRFLFFEGDWQNFRHTSPHVGVLLLADFALLLFGVVFLLRNLDKKEYLFIILWLILSPLPAAFSRDQIHAVRALNMVIPIVLISGIGLVNLIRSFEHSKKYIIYLGVVFYFINFIYFLDAYFIHMPFHNSKYWDYGQKQIVETTLPIKDKYNGVIVQQSYAQPYIYFLFFSGFDPKKYQEIAKLTESKYGDVGLIENLENIKFTSINWPVDRGKRGYLFVADPIRIPLDDIKGEDFQLIKEIKYLDGEVAYRIVEVK